MCCRYGYESGTAMDVRDLADYISPEAGNFRTGDVHTSDPAVVLKSGPEEKAIYADVMPWGFFSFDKKLMINARAESATEKKSFSDSILRRRCIIPASHFYEWDRNKIKNKFADPEGVSLYMAGFYNLFDQENRFIILTTAANESMAPVHDRMPLLLRRDQIEGWICRDDQFMGYLKQRPQELLRKTEYEQLSLF